MKNCEIDLKYGIFIIQFTSNLYCSFHNFLLFLLNQHKPGPNFPFIEIQVYKFISSILFTF